ADHDPGAAAQRAAAADTGPALTTPRSNPATQPTRCRAAREHARASLDRPPRAATHRRGTRARSRDRDDHSQARPAAARPARCRTACGRTTGALLVAPRTDQLRGGLRTPRRRSPDPRLLRANHPLPPRPIRRPQTQPRTAHDHRHTETLTPRHDRLHKATHPRGQDQTRGKPLPQALPRPQPLPPTRTRSATGHLTNIEASLAHAMSSAHGLIVVGSSRIGFAAIERFMDGDGGAHTAALPSEQVLRWVAGVVGGMRVVSIE